MNFKYTWVFVVTLVVTIQSILNHKLHVEVMHMLHNTEISSEILDYNTHLHQTAS